MILVSLHMNITPNLLNMMNQEIQFLKQHPNRIAVTHVCLDARAILYVSSKMGLQGLAIGTSHASGQTTITDIRIEAGMGHTQSGGILKNVLSHTRRPLYSQRPRTRRPRTIANLRRSSKIPHARAQNAALTKLKIAVSVSMTQ